MARKLQEGPLRQRSIISKPKYKTNTEMKETWRKLSRLPDELFYFPKTQYLPDEPSKVEEDEVDEPDEDLRRLRFKDFRMFVLGTLAMTGIAFSSALLVYYAKNTSTTYFHAPLWIIWFRSNWRIGAFPTFVLGKKLYQMIFYKYAEKEPVSDIIKNGSKIYGEATITPRVFFIDIAGLSTISIAMQYLTFAPSHFVSAGNLTALNATNLAWVYILSVIVLKVDIMPVKVLGVLSCLVGVILLAYQEGFSNPDWDSAVMSIMGALVTAIYQVTFKKRIGGITDLGKITFSVSALAFFTLFTMWPIVLILRLTKAERWQWDSIPWDIVCKHSAAQFAMSWLINLGLAWTNPVFVSLGFLMAVPIAHFFDVSLMEKHFEATETMGSILIGLGFLVLVLADRVTIDSLKDYYATLATRIVSIWSIVKKVLPAKGSITITEPTDDVPASISSSEERK